MLASTAVCSNHLLKTDRDQDILKVDGILVACFSLHPLTSSLMLDSKVSSARTSVTGIFEASVLTALSCIGEGQQWGIVTTGKFWEAHLTHGVHQVLGSSREGGNEKFAGVESTGLNASDFHDGVDPRVIEARLKYATKRLLERGNVTCIIMGCAGMAGLERLIRSAAEDHYRELGLNFEEKMAGLLVIDGVHAGILQLDQMIKSRRLFKRPEKSELPR